MWISGKMIHKTVGSGSDLAEIVIDYEKKSMKLYDPIKRTELNTSDLDFKLDYLLMISIFPVLIVFITMLLFFIFTGLNEIIQPNWNHFTLVFELLITSYLFSILLTPMRKKLHYFDQYLSFDFMKKKKFMVVQDINSKEWKLPHNFKNLKFDYKLYGDYAKYIKKVHIKPKPYSFKIGKKQEKQVEDWDAFIYFKKIPKSGKMEIEWI